MRYPDKKTYELLYSRYINDENLLNMIDMADPNYENKKFLDLCCGNGKASIQALKKNVKYCVMVDKEKDMLPKYMQKTTKKREFNCMAVADFLRKVNRFNSFNRFNKIDINKIDINKIYKNFDIAFCRQGINYWLNEECAENLANIMKKNSVFIFNTFNTKPPIHPIVKEYYLYNIKFVEISYVDKDDFVHHVQIREGMPPHITKFKWFSKEYFKNCLDKYFKIDIITRNKTDIYKCIRK